MKFTHFMLVFFVGNGWESGKPSVRVFVRCLVEINSFVEPHNFLKALWANLWLAHVGWSPTCLAICFRQNFQVKSLVERDFSKNATLAPPKNH